MNSRSMEEFWPYYMNQHSKAATRRWHFVGTLCSMLCLVYTVLFNKWFVIFVPILGYGLAWYSHFFVEGNVPATFGHPLWSLLCDWFNAHWSNGWRNQKAWEKAYFFKSFLVFVLLIDL